MYKITKLIDRKQGYSDYYEIELDGKKIRLYYYTKPSISKTLYYNDEYKSPGTDYETFKNYNLIYNLDLNYNDNEYERKKLVFLKMKDKDFYEIMERRQILANEFSQNFISGYFEIDDQTWEIIKEIDYLEKTIYIKRLKTYYKKYSDKIWTSGYWAER